MPHYLCGEQAKRSSKLKMLSYRVKELHVLWNPEYPSHSDHTLVYGVFLAEFFALEWVTAPPTSCTKLKRDLKTPLSKNADLRLGLAKNISFQKFFHTRKQDRHLFARQFQILLWYLRELINVINFEWV